MLATILYSLNLHAMKSRMDLQMQGIMSSDIAPICLVFKEKKLYIFRMSWPLFLEVRAALYVTVRWQDRECGWIILLTSQIWKQVCRDKLCNWSFHFWSLNEGTRPFSDFLNAWFSVFNKHFYNMDSVVPVFSIFEISELESLKCCHFCC